jgi:hypothetical protein
MSFASAARIRRRSARRKSTLASFAVARAHRRAIGAGRDAQREQCRDLLERKADRLGLTDESDARDRFVRIPAIPGGGTRWPANQAPPLVKPDGFHA